MNSRYIGSLLLLPLIIFLFLPGIYLKYAVMVLSILGLHEFYKTLKTRNINTINIAGYSLCVFYYIVLNDSYFLKYTLLLLVLVIFIMFCYAIIFSHFNIIDISMTVFGFIYIPLFFSFIYLVQAKQHGNYLVWLIFLSSWLCDTAAYYTGRFFGKHKLIPKISPNKTIEGSVGGMFGSIIGCVVFGMIVKNFDVNIELYHYMIIGILCGAAGQFGDLTASSIKRFCGIKDFSKLIPGHGGILDRFDSILFAAVVVYYYVTFIIGIN